MLGKGTFPRMAQHVRARRRKIEGLTFQLGELMMYIAFPFRLHLKYRCIISVNIPISPKSNLPPSLCRASAAKVKAMLHGRVLVIDEFDKAPTEVVLTLKGLLQLDDTWVECATEKSAASGAANVPSCFLEFWNITFKYLLELISKSQLYIYILYIYTQFCLVM